jgi:hypothetical protein
MQNHDRRRFLQSSVGVGAVLGLGAAGMSSFSPGNRGPGGDPANPAVVPGLVDWHRDFTTACRAAQGSGKPVKLLHMLGRLDQQFC